MIIFKENFKSCTDKRQPYSIAPEATHKYSSFDGYVDEGCFYIKRDHVRQLLIMPETGFFRLSAGLRYLSVKGKSPFCRWAWGVCLGYDRSERAGHMLEIGYADDARTVELILVRCDGVTRTELGRQIAGDVTMLPDYSHAFEAEYRDGRLKISLLEKVFVFDAELSRGIIALSKESGVTAAGFSNIAVEGDALERKELFRQTFRIPRTDGGAFDYCLRVSADMLDAGTYEIGYELSGGIYNNHADLQRADCWVKEYDSFWGLYFSFGGERLYISKGKLTFVDKEYPYLTELLDGSEIPYRGAFRVTDFSAPGKVFIGYDRRFSLCAGNLVSDRLFTFDKEGNLLFIGKELGDRVFFAVKSGAEKRIVQRIPAGLPDYEDACFHAKNNHYFFSDETPSFRVDVYSTEDEEYISLRAELQNTWFETVGPLALEKIPSDENVFEDCGYRKYSYTVACDIHAQGVYHLALSASCGSSAKYSHVSAFEVIDDSVAASPQETAGLPMIFCGDGIPTRYSTYDLAAVRPDFNIMHYVDSSMHIPEYVEKRRTWELLHLYHRRLLVWMTKRTLRNDGETWRDYPEATKNADYLNYIYPGIEKSRTYYRYDLWLHANFDVQGVRDIYASFLRENRDIAEYFPPVDENGGVDEDRWGRIPGECFDRWTSYINERTRPLFKKQWEEIRAVNPGVKRFSYGPYNLYADGYAGGYDTKWFGFSEAGLRETFDGFLQFEDYPFACGYKTHVSAFNMATIKQRWPDVRIAPEFYDTFVAGCPDGAVAFANPTTGASHAWPYQTVTQLYEYLYNTAIFERGGFRYWSDRMLQLYELISLEPEKRYRLLLKAWKIYLDNKPEGPLKSSTVFITDYDCADDARTVEIDTNAIYNKSQTAMGIVHEVNAEMGFPQGFVTDWRSLGYIGAGDADIVVLPSLRTVDDGIRRRIRELYANGAALIATSRIDGLEDIFGVTAEKSTERLHEIRYNGKSETVYPYTCSFPYRADGAEAVVYTGKNAVIFRKGRAMLINASLSEVGSDSYSALLYAGRANISRLARAAIRDFIKSVASPAAYTDERCGINLIKTADGGALLILTDYASYGTQEARVTDVRLCGLRVRGITNLVYDEHETGLNLYFKNGYISKFSVNIRPHETLVFKLALNC